ncbi:hypothetical protein ACFV3R_18790 [Streptomyces sp. NPDC059740]|uniref:DUF7144 family membrane protein n=1 Tax=Streptomyces sp. NPDC059740 TaxID=3346926 RepID=UPI00365BEF5B
MLFGGLMGVFEGIAAISRDSVLVRAPDYTFAFNLTGWGWLHVALGAVVALAGVALFRGAFWARIVGVVVAGASMLANFVWLPHYPLWGATLLVVDAVIIWALCTMGRTSRD